jgi:predicted RNase H-like nuclease
MEELIGGLSSCRAGWVLVTNSAKSEGKSLVEVIPDVADVIAQLDDGWLAAAGIDIPIGLPATGARPCDLEARKLIGPRRSSVFPAPFRSLLSATSFEEAKELSLEAEGKGVSVQTFSLLPKIKEVDRLMTPERQRKLVEVHPEVSFTVLAGQPMSFNKSKSEGRAERLAVLQPVFSDLDSHATRKIPGTQLEDVLNAFVANWSARRWYTGSHKQLGGEMDGRGLRMEMIA